MFLLLLEFIFFLLMMPVAFILGFIEVLIKIPFAKLTGKSTVSSFFIKSYAKFADEVKAHAERLRGEK